MSQYQFTLANAQAGGLRLHIFHLCSQQCGSFAEKATVAETMQKISFKTNGNKLH